MERGVSSRAGGCGLRKLSANHLVAAQLAERPGGLPPGVRHPGQLVAAMRRAAPYLGYRRLLPLMETLFRWTQPQDWAPDAAPIVWPSNETLAMALGCSERHVSRLIAAAIEARLISVRDNTDRKRRGLRQDGRILWAWGLDLRPMAARHPEFLRVAEDGEKARQRRRALQREARRARQILGQLLDLAESEGLPCAPLQADLALAEQWLSAARQAEDPDRVATLTLRLRTLAAGAQERLREAVECADRSGSDDAGVRAILDTNPDFEPERFSVRRAQEAGQVERSAPFVQTVRLLPGDLAAIAPRLGDFMLTPHPSWADVADAAAALAGHLGISQPLYGEACQQLGRRGAAAAVAIISSKAPGHFHTAGPAGYLKGMLRRAKGGSLFLERSLHALRQSHRSTIELTAVNSPSRESMASHAVHEMRYFRTNSSETAFVRNVS